MLGLRLRRRLTGLAFRVRYFTIVLVRVRYLTVGFGLARRLRRLGAAAARRMVRLRGLARRAAIRCRRLRGLAVRFRRTAAFRRLPPKPAAIWAADNLRRFRRTGLATLCTRSMIIHRSFLSWHYVPPKGQCNASILFSDRPASFWLRSEHQDPVLTPQDFIRRLIQETGC